MKDRFEIKERMQAGRITGASFATVDSQGHITPYPEGSISGQNSQLDVTKDTVFQCASLSKPVFAYLVLKLIEANKTQSAQTGLGEFKTDFDLESPLYQVFKDKDNRILEGDNNPFLRQFTDQEQAKKLTAKMVLSHTTGLPIMSKQPYQFQFEPGKHYAYSGPGIGCLQGAIEELTGTNLETLAQEHVFGKNALDMPKSTYGAEPSAANSLKTTAEEYAKFITTWINDDTLNYAFTPIQPADSMINDYLPNPKAVGRLVENITIEDTERNRVAWGLGIGLVKNDQGQVIGAYHTGDMGNDTVAWRAGVGAQIDPVSGRCVEASVYLTQSPNGHILAEQVLPEVLQPALNYFFPTYGFARNANELDGTNFHGLNPKILNSDLRNMAEKTKTTTHSLEQDDQAASSSKNFTSEESIPESSDSTKKMVQLMRAHPVSPSPEPAPKTVESQEVKVNSDKPTESIEKIKDEEVQEVQVFNPTPFSKSYDPYKN